MIEIPKINKVTLGIVLIALFLCLANTAYAQQDSLAEDTYVLIDGPGAGTKIFTIADTTSVTPDRNQITMAEGHFSGTDMNCDAMHYHGTLFGAPDPDPERCGWGKDMLLRDETEEDVDPINLISNAVESEQIIVSFLEIAPDGIEKRLIDPHLNDAANNLDELIETINNLVNEGRAKRRTASRISRLIKKIKKLDQDARNSRGKFPDLISQSVGLGTLNRAIRLKRQIVRLLTKSNILTLSDD